MYFARAFVFREANLYVGYFDEFGHNGLYVGRHDARYKTHPVWVKCQKVLFKRACRGGLGQ